MIQPASSASASPAEFEALAASYREPHYSLRLFITGMTPRSTQAIGHIKAICEERLPGHYDLEIVDIYKSPASAGAEQIVATPTLIRILPLPLRRIVGDLSNREKVLFGLDL